MLPFRSFIVMSCIRDIVCLFCCIHFCRRQRRTFSCFVEHISGNWTVWVCNCNEINIIIVPAERKVVGVKQLHLMMATKTMAVATKKGFFRSLFLFYQFHSIANVRDSIVVAHQHRQNHKFCRFLPRKFALPVLWFLINLNSH